MPMTPTNSQVRVLIAERTLSIAELIARSLRHQGYTIAGIVNSTEQAITYATLTAPDIVLLDLPLEGEVDTFAAGWKILSEIQCPVVYMTTQTKDLRPQNRQVNPYGFLLKPFTVEELKTTIDQTLAHYRQGWQRDRDYPPLPTALEPDDPLLPILAAASAISPMPRVVFRGDRWQIYTPPAAYTADLFSLCQHYTGRYPLEILAWNEATGEDEEE